MPAPVEITGMERFSGQSLENTRPAIGPNFDGNPNGNHESDVHFTIEFAMKHFNRHWTRARI
jgi:hypothetical protein